MTIKPTHPRLWLDDTRLQWLKTQPGRLEWKRLITNCEDDVNRATKGLPLVYTSPLNHALVYQVTGSQKHAAMAATLVELYLSMGLDAMLKVGTTSPHGFGARIVLPEVAVTYDWLHDALTDSTKKRWADQLMAWSDWCWLETNPTKGVPPLKNPDTWGQNNPGDNFYVGFLMTLIAALAVYGEHPRAQAHLDLGRQKLDALSAYLQKYGYGGVSLEGTNYGSWLRHAMLYAALDTATDSNSQMLHVLMVNAANSRWQLTAPDRKHLCPLGGQPVGADAPITEDHTFAPLVALSHEDPATKATAKSWLDSVTFTRKKANSWAPALWYRNEVKAENPFFQPLVYHAPGSGYVSMRSSWATDATWVVFQCGPVRESHQSYAAGEFYVWAKGQWLTGPARLWGLGGEMLPSEFNNVILVGRDEQGRWRGQPGQVGSQALPKDEMRIVLPPRQSGSMITTTGEAGKAYAYYKNAKVWPVLEWWQRDLFYTSPNKLVVMDTIRKVNPADEILWQLHCKDKPWIEGREYGILGTGVTLRGRCSLSVGAPVLSVGETYKGKSGALSSHRLQVLIPAGAKEVVVTNTLEIVNQ